MAVDLITNIILNGQTTSGFAAIGTKLMAMGALVDRIGSKVREFEKESVETYRNYEDSMLAARYALSAQYDSATSLNKVMDGLETAAQQWAATTIFHTDDVAEAVSIAAHAGWDYEQILLGIPNAMKIAQAGGMDLSEGLDYLVKMVNTTGTEFTNIPVLIDQWSMAANRSATDIQEMGEAFMSMSSSAMFADNTQELFTLLAVLANAGVTGSKAGTMMRAAMMRIVAPTKAAKEAMAELGATEEELAEWDTVDDTAAQLQELGFSAYDAEGNLLPMMDIFTNLHDSLKGMNEQARFDILSKIFPLRTINAATAFYNAIEKGSMAELFEAIGDSEGYAAKGADIMMSGLTGSIETLLSKWEEFQRSIGETLAPTIESIAGFLGNIVDGLNGMSETQLSALTGALTAISAAGPALLIAGGLIKTVATLGPWGTLMLAAAIGAAAMVSAMKKLKDLTLEESFGTMTVNLDTLRSHIDGLTTEFTLQKDAVLQWEEGLAAAQETYATNTSEFAEMLLTDVLTGKKLTDTDKKKLETYASEIYTSVLTGIDNAKARDMTFFDIMFGSPRTVAEDETGNIVGQMVGGYYDSVYAEAEAIGKELRDKMTEALEDNELNENERQAIQASVDRLNTIQAEIASQLQTEAYYTELWRSQSVSWETASTFLTENAEKQKQALTDLDNQYAEYYGTLRTAFDYAREHGTVFTDFDGNEFTITDENAAEIWGDIERRFRETHQSAREDEMRRWGETSSVMFDALMNDSAMSDAWNFMKSGLASGAITEGANGVFDLSQIDYSQYTPEQLANLGEQFDLMVSNASDMRRIMEPFSHLEGVQRFLTILDNAEQAAAMFHGESTTQEYSAERSDLVAGSVNEQLNLVQQLENDILSMGVGNAGDLISQWETARSVLDEMQGGSGELWEVADLPDWYNEYLQQKSSIEANPPQLDVTATLDTSAIDSWEPQPKYMDVYTRTTTGGGGGGRNIMKPYAEGGRADVPSIFGEAGAEWAIPEEHTQRTADLLDMARRASGFTWGDLLARNGGLNAGGGSVTVNYSPTINAGDAQGVADVLARDKDRLLRLVRNMMAEQRLRDEVAAFV